MVHKIVQHLFIWFHEILLVSMLSLTGKSRPPILLVWLRNAVPIWDLLFSLLLENHSPTATVKLMM